MVLQDLHNSVHLTVCDSAVLPEDTPLFTNELRRSEAK